MIFTKKFERLVRRRNTLVSEGVDSLLPSRHAVSIADENFAVIANGRVIRDDFKTDAACWLWVGRCKLRKGRHFDTRDALKLIEDLWNDAADQSQSRAVH